MQKVKRIAWLFHPQLLRLSICKSDQRTIGFYLYGSIYGFWRKELGSYFGWFVIRTHIFRLLRRLRFNLYNCYPSK
jgi:hypothetical protein